MNKPQGPRLRLGTATPGGLRVPAKLASTGFADTSPSGPMPFDDAPQAGDAPPSMARWRERRTAICATPSDAAAGAARLGELWHSDRHMARLADRDLRRLADRFQFVKVSAGQAVITQDEEGDYLVVVLEGQLAVERLMPGGERIRLAEARPGELLGEMALLDAGARFSTCTTMQPCTLAVIEADPLTTLLHEEPRLGVALLGSLSRRLSLRVRQLSARLSALLSRP